MKNPSLLLSTLLDWILKMAKKKSSLPVESPCSGVAYKATAADKARERQYQIEDGLRTMQRAGEIMKDKELMRGIKSFAKEQIQNLNKVAK